MAEDGAMAEHETVEARTAAGRQARKLVPRRSHGFDPSRRNVEPLAVLEQQNETRVKELVPVRHSRDGREPLHLLPRRGGRDGRGSLALSEHRHRGAARRRRAPLELRDLRRLPSGACSSI